MFDIGFWEIAVIGVIALLVVGPERLPGVARNVGRWVGRIRRYVSHVKQDIEREINADEVRQLLEQPEGLESIRDVARETGAVFDDTRKELNSAVNEAQIGSQADAAVGVDTVAVNDKAAEQRIPHHAVDDDPFASAQISTTATSDEPSTDEQRTEQPGQR
ncbi:MAG: sec-independent protein translocase protein TatB [Gammaproteobacteria bacterium]